MDHALHGAPLCGPYGNDVTFISLRDVAVAAFGAAEVRLHAPGLLTADPTAHLGADLGPGAGAALSEGVS